MSKRNHKNHPTHTQKASRLPDKIQGDPGKEQATSTRTPNSSDSPDHFHDTKHLLKSYRRIAYAVQMAEDEMNLNTLIDHGASLSTLETNAASAGIDVSDTAPERYTKDMMRSQRMLTIMQAALESVRKDPHHGEEYYAVLYETYFTKYKLPNHEAILTALENHGIFISASSYYNYLRQSIQAFAKILWGYTRGGCLEILEHFTQKSE